MRDLRSYYLSLPRKVRNEPEPPRPLTPYILSLMRDVEERISSGALEAEEKAQAFVDVREKQRRKYWARKVKIAQNEGKA